MCVACSRGNRRCRRYDARQQTFGGTEVGKSVHLPVINPSGSGEVGLVISQKAVRQISTAAERTVLTCPPIGKASGNVKETIALIPVAPATQLSTDTVASVMFPAVSRRRKRFVPV